MPKNPLDVAAAVKMVRRELNPSIDFAYIHISDLDFVGHRYGPDSAECRLAQCRIEEGIEEIVNYVEERFADVHWVIHGDHGMATVTRELNVLDALEHAPLEIERDYLVFLDSTMARFWFFNGEARSIIMDRLRDLTDGRFLNHSDRERYHIDYPHNRFGDELFLADPGVLIEPSFYSRKGSILGMHGYAPEAPEQRSGFIINSPMAATPRAVKDPADMRRIFPTVLEMLQIQGIRNSDLMSLLHTD